MNILIPDFIININDCIHLDLIIQGLSGGAIAGTVIGVIAAVLLLVIGAWIGYHRCQQPSQMPGTTAPATTFDNPIQFNKMKEEQEKPESGQGY